MKSIFAICALIGMAASMLCDAEEICLCADPFMVKCGGVACENINEDDCPCMESLRDCRYI